ncbi:hypothetical protein [Streptosporangium sp. NBC_01756]|uniref:hypothetical protein n=1 Tax=Streptosporangium sp. NBC_01756 TaxID=2975950 RepID=UPI002DDC8D91|nr:hypothetical protein [Streptosporangium sp. NBC_01756]WSC89095.1 hypothetical protein OIE48_13145 [Streptosporangium sp. NBC_01756]
MEQIPDPPARFRTAPSRREAAGPRRARRVRTPDAGGLGDLASDDRLGSADRGAVHPAGQAAEPAIVITITLPAPPSSRGGAVPGASEAIETPTDTGRSSIVTTGRAPGGAATALAAVDILQNQPELPGHVRTRARESASTARELGLETNDPAGAVVPIVLGPPETVPRVALICAERGVRDGYLRPLSVPAGRSCPRLTARANLSSDDPAVARGALTAVAEMKVTK